MNNAANAHASSRSTQPAAASHAAVALAGSPDRPQPARARLVPVGRLRSRPTLTCWITVHDPLAATALPAGASAPCEPSAPASRQDTITTSPRLSDDRN